MTCEPAVISEPEFAARMARFAPWPATRPVAVAVSGGADSLCLAWLTHRWGPALGLVIDHGLRPESPAEASLTRARLASFGMDARIARLDLAPGPGLAARARHARYAALASMAEAAGVADLLIGHQAGDQAETCLMRKLGRSGPAGLAAMASLVEHATMRMVRPLLDVQPGRLRATLEAAGLSWVEDPSNNNAASLRTGLRRQLASWSSERTRTLIEAARQYGMARTLAEDRLAAVLARRVSIHQDGFALLSPGPIEPAALAQLLRALTGAPYAPSVSLVSGLADNPRPATCAGVQILPAGRLGPGLLLVREAAAMAADIEARPGALWDRRFRLPNDLDVPAGATLGALGADASALRRTSALPAAVLRTMPALRQGGQVMPAPQAMFSPSVPLAGGRFFA